MTFWSDIKLENNLINVIDPADPSKVDTSGYRLSVGNKVYITKASANRDADKKDKITIPPGQFALISTKEKVTVPQGSIGFISIRAKIKFRGLINVSGFHVDPGYSDHLIFSVFNAGPKDITILKGDDIFLIWFADLDQNNRRSKGNTGLNGNIPSELINNVNMQVDSTAALSAKITFFERTLLIATPILLFLAGIMGTILYDAYETLHKLEIHSDVADAKDDDINKEISSLKTESQSLKLGLDSQKYSDSQKQILESINARLAAIESKQSTPTATIKK